MRHEEPCPALDHRPCGPVRAVLTLYNGNRILLCRDDTDDWLDRADDDPALEPVDIAWRSYA